MVEDDAIGDDGTHSSRASTITDGWEFCICLTVSSSSSSAGIETVLLDVFLMAFNLLYTSCAVSNNSFAKQLFIAPVCIFQIQLAKLQAFPVSFWENIHRHIYVIHATLKLVSLFAAFCFSNPLFEDKKNQYLCFCRFFSNPPKSDQCFWGKSLQPHIKNCFKKFFTSFQKGFSKTILVICYQKQEVENTTKACIFSILQLPQLCVCGCN